MTPTIFLSYAHRDAEAARRLYKALQSAGHSIWFDEESLLPGQDWELEIRTAITGAKVVLICLSSHWVDQRGYIQKELKLALEVMNEIPEGQIHTIPVRFDDAAPPPSLAKLQWVDAFEPHGMDKLQRSLQPLLASRVSLPSTSSHADVDAFTDFMEDIITRGGLIHRDVWEEATSNEELAFKRLLKDRWNHSWDLYDAKRYEDIITLWAPLNVLDHFHIDHNEWSDKPYFRCQIHTAKGHLFVAHVQLGVRQDPEVHMPMAFGLLQEVLKGNPYSMRGAASDRLSVQDAEAQNLNYKDVLEFALQWFKGWGQYTLQIFGISTDDVLGVERRIRERLYEIQVVLRLRGASD